MWHVFTGAHIVKNSAKAFTFFQLANNTRLQLNACAESGNVANALKQCQSLALSGVGGD